MSQQFVRFQWFFSDFFEHITQIAFPKMSATPNLPKKDPATDRFCFLYDCFFGLQLGPAWIELSIVVQNNQANLL